MENADHPRNTSILSQSYMNGVKRITGKSNTFDEDYKIDERLIEKRQQTWTWLFEKFSEISDDIELNIQTLKPDTESSDSHDSEQRFPVRKTTAQIQYWIDTGNPPCQVAEAEIQSDMEGTLSISESEGEDFELTQSSPSASMIVNNKLDNSGGKLITTESSTSSVDTATYIKSNINTFRINDEDNRAKNFRSIDNNIVARSINAAIPRVLLTRIPESKIPKKIVLQNKSVEIDEENSGNCSSGIVASTEIVSDKVNRDQSDETKTSEVTFKSKEFGIGSLAVKSTEEKEEAEAKRSSSSADETLLNSSQSLFRGKRKLFTEKDNIFDLISLKEEKAVQNSRRSIENSFHPALDSPSTVVRKKVRARPKLLTLLGHRIKKSKYLFINGRNRNKSLLSKSRALQNSQKSYADRTTAAVDVETRNFAENKSPNHSVKFDHVDGGGGNIQTTSEVDKTVPKKLNSVTEITKQASMNKSVDDHSSSLSSQDVSQIINEELNKDSVTPFGIVQKKYQPRDPSDANIRKSDREVPDSDQGSIFKTCAGLLSETRESRIERMQKIRKNLCTTDLKSSEETESPSNFSLGVENNLDIDDSISNASTILLSNFGRGVRGSKKLKKCSRSFKGSSAEFIPVVILHDFLKLRNCCGRSERENREFWLRKQNEKEYLRNRKRSVEETTSKMKSNKINRDNLTSKQEMERIILKSKKPRLENRSSASDQDTESLIPDFDTQESQSPEKEAANAKIEETNGDSNCSSNHSDGMKPDTKLGAKGKSNVTFTNTKSSQLESIFVLTSSDDEDFLKTLSMTSKSMSSSKKVGDNNKEIVSPISTGKNKILNASGLTKRRQESYTIVFSNSDEEEETVKKASSVSGSRKVRRRYSERNKRKNSKESRLTTCLEEDKCTEDRSEDFIKNVNDKLEKQSLGVNRCSVDRKKSKQSPETSGEYLVSGKNKYDTENSIDQNSSAAKITGNGRKLAPKVSSTKKMITKDNHLCKIDDSLKTPVDRLSNTSQKLGEHNLKRGLRRKNSARELDPGENKWDRKAGEKNEKSAVSKRKEILPRNIMRAGESFDSVEEEEEEGKPAASRVPNYRANTKINSPEKGKKRNDRSIITNGRKTCAEPKLGQISSFDDELSSSGDVMSFSNSKNYACDKSRDKNNRNEKDEEHAGAEKFSSKRNSASRNNRAIHNKKDPSREPSSFSSSKRKLRDRRITSNIVFQTKECWESGSDNS